VSTNETGEKTMGIPVKVENVVICYPHMWNKRAAVVGGKEKYSAEFILDPSSNAEALNHMLAAFNEALNVAGKGAMAEYIDKPFRSGEAVNRLRASKGKPPRPELEGKWMIRCSSDNLIPVLEPDGRTQILEDRKSMVFSGCIVNALLDFYWWEQSANPGVFVGCNGVQLVSNVNVERIATGGAPAIEDLFAPIEGAPKPIAPTSPPPGAPQTPAQNFGQTPPWGGGQPAPNTESWM
jgi:hypothetical protein